MCGVDTGQQFVVCCHWKMKKLKHAKKVSIHANNNKNKNNISSSSSNDNKKKINRPAHWRIGKGAEDLDIIGSGCISKTNRSAQYQMREKSINLYVYTQMQNDEKKKKKGKNDV